MRLEVQLGFGMTYHYSVVRSVGQNTVICHCAASQSWWEHSVRGIVAQWVGTNPPLTVCALSARRALSFVAGRIPFLCSLIHAFSLPFSLLLSPLVSVHATEQNTVIAVVSIQNRVSLPLPWLSLTLWRHAHQVMCHYSEIVYNWPYS